MSDLLVVIPTFRAWEYAVRTVRTALASTPGCTAAVVDDGSPDWAGNRFAEFGKRVITHHFRKNAKSVTRSWEWGARLARERKFRFVAFGNSDLKFPPGWWPPVRAALTCPEADGRLHLAGPFTNAPGHRVEQNIRNRLPGYKPDDSDAAVASTQRALDLLSPSPVKLTGRVNGFLFAVETEILFTHPFDDAHVFHPGARYRMERSEDQLCGRFAKAGLRVGAVRDSFVFHYRGVSRPAGRRGKSAAGLYRPKGDRS